MDLADVDIRRVSRSNANRRYLHDRTVEALGLLYAMHWPYRQHESARGVRRSALHRAAVAAGACFGEAAGWERPTGTPPPGVKPAYEYSYGRQNWFAYSAEEHRAVREASACSISRRSASSSSRARTPEAALDRIYANDVAVPVGRVVYTQWLNPRGGIEADVTVTRESETRFLIVTSAASQTRDLAWLKRHIPADAARGRGRRDLGPRRARAHGAALARFARKAHRRRSLQCRVSVRDVAGDRLRLGAGEGEPNHLCRRARLGALRPDRIRPGRFDLMRRSGAAIGLKLAGYHAMNSLRLEKAYRHWGHDITDEDSPDEAGLSFAVKPGKARDFIGREALLSRRERRRPAAAGAIRAAGRRRRSSTTTSRSSARARRRPHRLGMFGHTLGRAVGLGYVENGGEVVAPDWVTAGDYAIEIAGLRHPARAHLRPVYDPKGLRIRA